MVSVSELFLRLIGWETEKTADFAQISFSQRILKTNHCSLVCFQWVSLVASFFSIHFTGRHKRHTCHLLLDELKQRIGQREDPLVHHIRGAQRHSLVWDKLGTRLDDEKGLSRQSSDFQFSGQQTLSIW